MRKMAEHPESVSIVIPCWNERETVLPTLEAIKRVVEKHRNDTKWEIIVVDDCSTDGSIEKLKQAQGIRCVFHPTNRGYGAAIKTGIRAATGEVIVTIDADGQHDPACIPQLLEDKAVYHMVIASRMDANVVPFLRRPGKRILAWLMQYLLGEKVPDINSGLRAFRRETMLTYLHLCSNGFSFTMSSTMAFMADGSPVCFVPAKFLNRTASSSSVGVRAACDSLLRIVRLGTVFYPLRLFAPVIVVFLVGGIISLINDVRNMNLGDTTVILFLSSVMLFFFALLADQLSHIRREMR